jgi:hypothetical protein
LPFLPPVENKQFMRGFVEEERRRREERGGQNEGRRRQGKEKG